MANDCKYSVRYYPMTSFYSLNNFKIIKILVRRNTNRDDSNNKNNNDHDEIIIRIIIVIMIMCFQKKIGHIYICNYGSSSH